MCDTAIIGETTPITWEIAAPDYAASVVTITDAQAEHAIEQATEPAQPEPEPEPVYNPLAFPVPDDDYSASELSRIADELCEFGDNEGMPLTTHRDWTLYATTLITHLESVLGLISHYEKPPLRQLQRVVWAMDHLFDQAVLDVAEKEEKISELETENDDLQERIKTHNQSLESAYSLVDEARDAVRDTKRSLDEVESKLDDALDSNWPEDL